MKEIECNCPLCKKTSMKNDEIYRCIKSNGIMGLCSPNTADIPAIAIKKALINYYDNEKNN